MKYFKQSPVDLDEKKRMRRFIASPLTLMVLMLFIGIAAWKTWDMYAKWQASDEALMHARDSYEDLRVREAFLSSKIDSLSTEAGVEAEIRERFGVAKEGEKVIVILNEEEQEDATEENAGWWVRFRSWFTAEE